MFDMLNKNNNKNQNLKQGTKFINKLKQQINNVMSNSSLITEGIDCPSNMPYPCPNMPGTTKCALNQQSCKKISKELAKFDEYGCEVSSGYKYCGKDIFDGLVRTVQTDRSARSPAFACLECLWRLEDIDEVLWDFFFFSETYGFGSV